MICRWLSINRSYIDIRANTPINMYFWPFILSNVLFWHNIYGFLSSVCWYLSLSVPQTRCIPYSLLWVNIMLPFGICWSYHNTSSIRYITAFINRSSIKLTIPPFVRLLLLIFGSNHSAVIYSDVQMPYNVLSYSFLLPLDFPSEYFRQLENFLEFIQFVELSFVPNFFRYICTSHLLWHDQQARRHINTI